MQDPHATYQNPLAERYASAEMLSCFSDQRRYRTWRRLWVALASAQCELGLPVTREQVAELEARVDDVDFERVAAIERELRHDVMAHITAYGEQCPRARPIIHLGATSCFVTDNADLILMRDGLRLLVAKLCAVLAALRDFALEHRALPALAYTHLQPAQLTTVGKRAALWAQDLLLDLEGLEGRLSGLRFRGAKGTTGTQASFLRLFGGDAAKVRELDRLVSRTMGFERAFTVTGQTYTRKVDEGILHAIASIAHSVHKMTNDLRILQSFGEVEEPFGQKQVGSSAMPYKRNPMRLERASSLAKHVICEAQNAGWIHATQWFERTLDDSANRRLSIPLTFLAADAILLLVHGVLRGLQVYPDVIRRRIDAELPFMASEDILMLAVERGGDRQHLHERIRVHAMDVVQARRGSGAPNDLLERLAADPAFTRVRAEIAELRDPSLYVGRAPEQVEEFFAEEVAPALARNGAERGGAAWEVRV